MNTIFILSTSVFIIVSLLLTYGLYLYKGRISGLIMGLVMGLVGMAMFLCLINFTDFNSPEILEQTRNSFNIIGWIFIHLILYVVPIYLILIIMSLVFSGDFKNIKKRTYGISVISLLGLSVFGMLIALLLIPIIISIPQSLWDNAIAAGGDIAEGEGGFNWGILLIFGVIILSFVISITSRILMKEDSIRKTNDIVQTLLKYLTLYFKGVIFLVPVVLLTRLSTIGMTEEFSDAAAKLLLMFIYIGIYLLGALIILGSLFTFIILTSDKNLTFKEKSLIIWKYILIAFANQSAAVTLIDTQETSRELGVCDEISMLTPTKGLFMGMVMCNGFTPMIMSLMILSGGGILTVGAVLTAMLLIFSLSISTSGAGSSDYWITATTMKVMEPFGVTSELFTSIYLNIVLVAHEVNEITVPKTLNGLGHISATLLTEKYHHKVTKCNHDDTVENEAKENESN